MLTTLLLSLLTFLPLAQPPATPTPSKSPAPTPKTLSWTLDSAKREAIVYLPSSATTTATPVIFAFHGHGGNAKQAARSFDYQKEWPEAITVYMQGLPTPGALTDPKGERNGWQKAVGEQSDRDVKFFDAVLATLRADYKIDDTRIYCTGHSNGGGFTYLLWSARPDVFAAVAPSSAAPGGLRDALALTPKPCMHIAGESDPLVKFTLQQRAMDRVKKVNNCETTGKQWGSEKVKGATATIYDSKSNSPATPSTPFISLIHPGGHEFLNVAPPLVVKFFKEHTNPAKNAPGPAMQKPTEQAKPAAAVPATR